jgi:hypothetical protein
MNMSDAVPATNDAAQRARTEVARLFDADRASQALGIVFAFACNSRGVRHGIYDVAVTNAAGSVLAQFRGALRTPAQ